MGGNESWNFILRGGILVEWVRVIEFSIGTLRVRVPGMYYLLNLNKF
jgi:hypothetical protein